MKVKELMQNDYVMVGDKVCRVIEIHVKSALLRDKECNAFEIREEHIEPIRLTEQMLVKNGFFDNGLRDGSHKIYFDYAHYNYIEIYRENYDEMYFKFDDAHSYAHINNLSIRYFHELQHIFRICKINKRFKL